MCLTARIYNLGGVDDMKLNIILNIVLIVAVLAYGTYTHKVMAAVLESSLLF